jgi:acetylornithine deacetylase/succinyl-diaminopimelate desuccinylase-like protein
MTSRPIDFEGALWDCINHLQTLIRIDTVNPPGNEMSLARYLDDVLRGAGIASTLFEPAPGRAALVGRIPGSGRFRPLLLLAHMDVVGVERAKWKTNPFGGEILDGYLYGRGAIDDKGMLAVNLETMLLLQRHLVGNGVALERDVVMVATSDEETGGTFGIDWLIENHRDLLDAEYALNEGGRVRVGEGRASYCAVQCSEKVPNVLRLVAHGPSGHASIPLPGNAIARLARAITAVTAYAEPVHLTDVTRRFLSGLAEIWPDERERRALADVGSDDPARAVAAANVLMGVPHLDAVLRNGISPTLLSGGIRANVIPGDATATLNVRTLPGESIDALARRLRRVIGDDDVDIDIVSKGEDAPPSSVDSPMYAAIEDAVRELDPAIRTIPYLSTGATDSAALRRVGVVAYGLLPFPLTQDDEARMHGHDERIPVASLSFGIKVTYDIVRRVSAPAEHKTQVADGAV